MVAHTEPVLLARSYDGSEYYAEPLYAKPLEIRDDDVDNNKLAIFAADYPNRWMVDEAMEMLADVGIKAEVHRLRLLDKEENDDLKAHLCYFGQVPHTTGQADAVRAANTHLTNKFARRVLEWAQVEGQLIAASA